MRTITVEFHGGPLDDTSKRYDVEVTPTSVSQPTRDADGVLLTWTYNLEPNTDFADSYHGNLERDERVAYNANLTQVMSFHAELEALFGKYPKVELYDQGYECEGLVVSCGQIVVPL